MGMTTIEINKRWAHVHWLGEVFYEWCLVSAVEHQDKLPLLVKDGFMGRDE